MGMQWQSSVFSTLTPRCSPLNLTDKDQGQNVNEVVIVLPVWLVKHTFCTLVFPLAQLDSESLILCWCHFVLVCLCLINIQKQRMSINRFSFFRKSFSSDVTVNCTNSRDNSISERKNAFLWTNTSRVLIIKNEMGAWLRKIVLTWIFFKQHCFLKLKWLNWKLFKCREQVLWRG